MTVSVGHVVDQTGRWHSSELAEGSGYRFAELWVEHIQALLDLGLAGDFFPKSLVPQHGQLWTSPAAVQGSLK